MKLPNAEKAYVEKQKLTGYLLNLSHPVGFSKAKFFRANGFNESNVAYFENELLKLAIQNEVAEIEETSFGKVYVVIGSIDAPNGQKLKVRTVWEIRDDAENPRFVTAYPES
jgi:aspartate/tyrosine/aromatic aminotransferase